MHHAPPTEPRPAQARPSLTTLLVAVIVIVALYFAQDVLMPLALAMLLSFLLSPIVARLERLGIQRTVAVISVVLAAILVVALMGWVVKNQFVEVADKLPAYREEIAEKFRRLRESVSGVGKATRNIEHVVGAAAPPSTAPTTNPSMPPIEAQSAPGVPALPHVTPQSPLPVRNYPEPASAVQYLIEYIGRYLHPLAISGLVVVFVIFMLIQREDLRDRIVRLAGPEQLNVTTQAVDDSARRIARYLLAQACVNAAYGVCVAAGLWGIGRFLGHGQGAFPNVLLWGMLCGLSRFIPYVGIWLSASLPLAVSLAFFHTNAVFFATAGMFILLEIAVAQFAEPYVYGSSTGMTTLAVLVAAVFWTTLWGPVGLLLSTPLTVILVVLGKYVPQLAFIDILLGDEPVLEPYLRLYQRLLALDEEEAVGVAREFVGECCSLELLYDQVLLPALAAAQRDVHHGKLQPNQQEFIYQGLRNIIEEVNEPAPTKTEPEQPPGPKRMVLAAERKVSVLVLPARDQADEIAGLMLTRLLADRGFGATNASADSLASELTQLVDRGEADITVVSALPPAAASRARYLCKRLMEKGPKIKVIFGLWLFQGDVASVRERISCGPNAPIACSIKEAQDQIDQLAQPLLAQ